MRHQKRVREGSDTQAEGPLWPERRLRLCFASERFRFAHPPAFRPNAQQASPDAFSCVGRLDGADTKLACVGFVQRAAGYAGVERRMRRSIRQLTFCVAWYGFPFMLSGKLGRLGKLFVQSYQQPFAKLYILLERVNLLEKLALPFPNQIRLQGQKPRNLLENLRFTKLLKPERLIMPFLNQIKKWLKLLKLGLLEFELL
jgi:hypothetical protein